MQADTFYSLTTMLGIILILLGVAVILVPLIARYFTDIEKVHPLLLIGVRFNGLYIGTSPILILALLIVYLFLRYYS